MRRQVAFSLVSSFLLCCPFIGAMAVDSLPRQILVFGGNGMIGSATMEKFLDEERRDDEGNSNAPRDKYVLVHRGNWYWDSGYTIRPHVRHIKCDRLNKLENCPELSGYVASVPHIDVVVDFSAYHPDSVTEALQMLQGKGRLYIYISTDSVYEVCEKKHKEFTREEDATRPTDSENQSVHNNKDSYGNYKLQCEEVLIDHRKNKNGPPHISLRLPDVIGPRDNTYRWWIYQLWMKLQPYLEKPVEVPKSLVASPLSFVYVNDVAAIIKQLAHNSPKEAIDQAFNLAIRETPTLSEVIHAMKNELNLTDVKIEENQDSGTIRLYPSVTLGPINISKAERVLNWAPTDWPTVVKETVQYYESAIRHIYVDRQRNDVIQMMQRYFTSKPYDVIRGLKNIYGLSYAERKDEL